MVTDTVAACMELTHQQRKQTENKVATVSGRRWEGPNIGERLLCMGESGRWLQR
jgi:hypothetical protein